MNKFDLLKSHIDAYTRKDGVVVGAHDDKRPKRIEAHGVKGMKSTPWRKTFKSSEHLDKFLVDGSHALLGARELEHDEPDSSGKTNSKK